MLDPSILFSRLSEIWTSQEINQDQTPLYFQNKNGPYMSNNSVPSN